MKVLETPSFVQNKAGKYKIFIMDYVPENQVGPAFLILNPLGGERNVIDAVLVNLARHLALSGNRVVRFDYFGTGDSDGDFGQITLDTLMSDVYTALNYIHAGDVPAWKIGLIGVRFGALLAMQVAEKKRKFIEHLILCAPIVSSSDYFNAELMSALSMQTVLFKQIIWDRKRIVSELKKCNSTVMNGYNLANLNGFPLTKKLYETVKKLDMLNCTKAKFSANCFIIHIDNRKRKVCKQTEILKKRYAGARVDCVELLTKQGLPWVHGKTLQKILRPLNEEIASWLVSHGRNNTI